MLRAIGLWVAAGNVSWILLRDAFSRDLKAVAAQPPTPNFVPSPRLLPPSGGYAVGVEVQLPSYRCPDAA